MTDGELSLADELRVDDLCADFEARLSRGERPELAEFVDGAPEHLRARLDRELRLVLEEFERPTGGSSGPPLELPERFGGYRILRPLGSGGMGAVYEAMQDHPRRRVALKVIRPDLITHRLRQRFGREIKLLAHLQHPGIARVLDAGSAEIDASGRDVPYLAMDLVPGTPLLEYAKERGLGVRQRVALVRQLCHAIQHAHDHGIVHRDLKPANVLVTPPGSRGSESGSSRESDVGHAVILDFGVARAVGSRGSGTLETQAGQVLGTLSHMAPEQLEGDPSSLDGRCDVYALGVVLFELLTGTLPIDLEGLSVGASMDRIRDVEPKRLVAHDRELRGDLETIVAKALEKEPARRYTAMELGEDLQRFLDDEPIRARPPSAIYQLRKFSKRNPGLVAALSTGAVLVVIALVVVSWLALEQSRLRANAERARQWADIEANKAIAVSAFQRDMLAKADIAKGGRTEGVLLVDVLNSASEELDGSFDEQPLVEASLRLTIGEALTSLQELERAEPHLRRAIELRERVLGPTDVETLRARSALGVLLESAERFDESLTEHEFVLAAARTSPSPDPRDLVGSINNVATNLESLGRFDESIALHREALATSEAEFGPGSLEVAKTLNNLASAIEYGGDLEGARPYYERCVEIRRRELESPHALLANAINNLGALHLRLFELDRAEGLLVEALEMRKELLGPRHSIVAGGLTNLAALYFRKGDLDRCEATASEALAVMEETYEPGHRAIRTVRMTLSRVHEERGEWEEALALALELREGAIAAQGPLRRESLLSRLDVVRSLVALERFEEADVLVPKIVEDSRESLGTDSVTAAAILELARMSARNGDHGAAEREFGEAIEAMVAAVGESHLWSMRFRAHEVRYLVEEGRHEAARERAKAALALAVPALGQDDPLVVELREVSESDDR